MAYTGFTYRLAYRRATLRQGSQGGREKLPTDHDKLIGHLLGCPLVVQTEASTANAISGTFIVPTNEVWLLYSVSLVVSGGTVPHPMAIAIDLAKRVSDTGDTPCYQFNTYNQNLELQAATPPATVASANDGPYMVNLYPLIIREGEMVYFNAGAEQQ